MEPPQQPKYQSRSKNEPMKSSVNAQKSRGKSSDTVVHKCNQQPSRTKRNSGFSLFSTKSFRVGKKTADRSIGLKTRNSISRKSKKSVGICEKSEKKGRLRSILRKKPSKLIEIWYLLWPSLCFECPQRWLLCWAHLSCYFCNGLGGIFGTYIQRDFFLFTHYLNTL